VEPVTIKVEPLNAKVDPTTRGLKGFAKRHPELRVGNDPLAFALTWLAGATLLAGGLNFLTGWWFALGGIASCVGPLAMELGRWTTMVGFLGGLAFASMGAIHHRKEKRNPLSVVWGLSAFGFAFVGFLPWVGLAFSGPVCP
jgi:hypothetical protein